MLLADRAYDSDTIRGPVQERGAWANIPPKRNRKHPICFSPHLYRDRNNVERFFNRIKHCRRIATRHDKLAANFLAFIKLAATRLWLRVHESTPQLAPRDTDGVAADLDRFAWALIVSRPICPPMCVSIQQKRPFLEPFKRGVKTGALEDYIATLHSALEDHGIRTVTGRLPACWNGLQLWPCPPQASSPQSSLMRLSRPQP